MGARTIPSVLPFLHPLGLVALLAVPVVLALHLFRRRFRPHAVSALFLWADAREVPAAGRRREPLYASPSLWCELAVALACALALASPRGCAPSSTLHLVCVLDDSASLSAATADGSLRERAVDAILERLDALGSAGRATLVLSGARPELLAGPGALAAEARAALATWEPGSGRHDLAPAVALGCKLAAGGRVLVVTDAFAPETYPEEVELVAVGEPLANAGFVRARRERERDEGGATLERIELAVAHSAPKSARAGSKDDVARVDVELAAAGTVLARRTLELAPGAREELVFRVPESAETFEARLAAGGGALAADDAAFLVPPPPRTVALASTLDRDTLRQLGLAARAGGSGSNAAELPVGPSAGTSAGTSAPARGSSGIDRWLALVDDSIESEPALAHALLGAPESVPNAPVVLDIAAPGAQRADWIGPFLVEKRHPLLAGVTLEGVVWSADPSRVLPGIPLVSAGNVPLVTEEGDGARRVFHANLDPGRSTLARSPDWPILLANLAELARAELFGPARTNLAVGEAFVYRARDRATWTLAGPGGERELAANEVLVLDDLAQPGVYELTTAGARCRFALSFLDAAESDLTALSAGERDSAVALAGMPAGATPLERALLVAALGFVLLDAWVLARARDSGAREAGAAP